MYVYKYMTQDKTTRGGYKWRFKRWHKTSGIGDRCSSGWLHSYEDPFAGMILKCFHVRIQDPILVLCKASGHLLYDNFHHAKLASTRLMPLTQIDQPIITGEYLKLFSIFAFQKLTFKEPINEKKLGSTKKTFYWIKNYLSNKERSDLEGQKILSALDKSHKCSGYQVLRHPSHWGLKFLSSILNEKNTNILRNIPGAASRLLFYHSNALQTVTEFNDLILSGEIPITEKRSEILKYIKMVKKYANKVD